MATPTKIRIESEADLRGYEAALRKQKELTHAADDFIKTMKLGVGIDLGGKLVGAIGAIPTLLQNAIAKGVAFNVTMSDSETAISNVLQQFLKLDKQASKNEAAKAMQQIVDLEPKTAATLEGLVQGFMATSASALSTGMTIQQNIDLVAKFANALANANIPAEQLSQELRAIFTGNIGPDAALGKLLNISNSDIERARELGNLYEFLTKKLGTLGDAGDTFAVRFSSLQSAIDKALGEISKPVFDNIRNSLGTLAQQLSDPKTINSLRSIGVEAANIVKTGTQMITWAIKNADTLMGVAKAAERVGVALAALKIVDIVAGLGLNTAAWVRNTMAIEAETAALVANTAATATNAATKGIATEVGGATAGQAVGSALTGVGMGAKLRGLGKGLLRGAGKGLYAAALAYLGYKAIQENTASADKQADGVGGLDTQNIGRLGPKLNESHPLVIDPVASIAAGEKQGDIDSLTRDIGRAGANPLSQSRNDLRLRREALQFGISAVGGGNLGKDFTTAEASTRINDSKLTRDQKVALLTDLKAISELEQKITEQERQQNDAETARDLQRQKEKEDRDHQREDLKDEISIQKALLLGNKTIADELTRQRDLRHQIKALEDQGFTEKEAQDLAKQTSELQKQISLKEKKRRMDETDAQIAVDNAETRGSRQQLRKAKEDQFRLQKRHELEDQGFEGSALETRLDQETNIYRRRTRRAGGYIDGSASVAKPRSGLSSGSLSSGTLSTGRFGDGIQTSPSNQPSRASGDSAASELNKAGQKLANTADNTLKQAAQSISSAADAVKTEMENLRTDLTSSFNGLKTEITTLRSQVNNLRSK